MGTWESLDPRAVLRANDVSVKTQMELVQVYQLLAGTTLAAAVGAAFQMQTHLVPAFVATMGMFALMMAIISSSPGGTRGARVPQLLGFGFFQGTSMAGLIELADVVDESIVPSAFAGTVVLFGSLTVAALYSRRRSYLYLGASLMSALSWLVLASLFNWFFKSPALFAAELWAGLGVFLMFVLFDSQLIVEKLEAGDYDNVRHALDLFLDLASIFVRLVAILVKNRLDEKDRGGGEGQGERRGKRAAGRR